SFDGTLLTEVNLPTTVTSLDVRSFMTNAGENGVLTLLVTDEAQLTDHGNFHADGTYKGTTYHKTQLVEQGQSIKFVVTGQDKDGKAESWIEETEFKMAEGSKASDLSEKAFKEKGLTYSSSTYGTDWYLNNITSPFDSTNTLGTQKVGNRWAYWHFLINGEMASVSAGGYTLQEGDVISWVYSLDEPYEYTVTFNSNGGSDVPSQTVVDGSKATKPDNPTKAGFKFAGWFTDEGLTNEYDFTEEVTMDVKLYAKWIEAKQYNVTRLWGDDCYGTNVETLRQDVANNGAPNGVIVCNTDHYIDSLSGAALAGLLDYPILLVNGTSSSMNEKSQEAINLLTNDGANKINVVILGGKFAITESIEAQLSAFDTDGACERVYGDDGYDTNKAVYEYGAKVNGGWNSSEVLVATGGSFHDALGAGSYAASKKSFILLANPSGDNSDLVTKAGNHGNALILGGKYAVSEELEAQLNSAGITTSRLAGDDAYATNIAFVNQALKSGMKLDYAGFSTGRDYYDALGSSHILGKANSVMFLVALEESYNQNVYDILKNSNEALEQGVIFGGTAVVTDVTKDEIIKSRTE
ncbi:MAG: cell wall-binding repeat-containing protein, partial [Phoenicibacter congonensis]|nr:cell wall-binding repeat-containing protein [Phoenicibacter congonensis]